MLTPGQRVGYIAVPPTMPSRDSLRQAILIAQLVTGYAFPDVVLQYAIPELENIAIDVAALQRKRNRMVYELSGMGYALHVPEGTFYLLVRSPIPDDLAFTKLLVGHHIYCLPGIVFDLPGYFRISLTAEGAMIERALPGFARVLEATKSMERGMP